MSRPSVDKDQLTKLWRWWDESWNIGGYGYATREAAVRGQRRYAERVLEGVSPVFNAGDYAWCDRLTQHSPGKTPVELIRPAAPDPERAYGEPESWVVRTLTGDQVTRYAKSVDDLELIPAMELLALASSDWWSLKL